jgi:hypothetical protein
LATVSGQRLGGRVHAGQQLVHREQLANQAGRADRDVTGTDHHAVGPAAQHRRGVLGGGVRVPEALRAGAGVGAARVEDHGADDAALEHLLAPEHRSGLDPVAGEDGGRRVVGAVVDDQGDVGIAAGLEPGSDTGGPEATRRSDGH